MCIRDRGAATDLENEGLRRLVVNGVYWGLGMDVPAKADVAYVGEYKPTPYGFKGYRKGIKPQEHALTAARADANADASAAQLASATTIASRLQLNNDDHVAIIG